MDIFPVLLLFSIVAIVLLLIIETWAPSITLEGFKTLTAPTSYWAGLVAPRYDIGPDQEDFNFIRDPRYFNDYADVTRIGVNYDFCRMVAPVDDKTNYFFACALAGTENLSSTKFRTDSVSDGFRISTDDYMRDINGDGRDDYCRILKWRDGSYQPVCAKATDLGFDTREIVDSDPPEAIQTLLQFYQGCVIWLRFYGNLLDTVENVKVQTSGNLAVDETPRRDSTEGQRFDGINQFLRLSDTSDLSLGMKVPLRSIRAWHVWVKFDEFTNNAKIFDFGNGSAKSNVFLGLYGKGDQAAQGEDLRPLLCGPGGEGSTVPSGTSGAQPPLEMTPKHLMETTDANVNEFRCVGFEAQPRKLPKTTVNEFRKRPTGRATLLYEVWDQQQRKMRIKLNNAFPKGQWTHVVITAINNDAFRPNVAVYINGKLMVVKESGFLPAASSMTNCYIGKSNWSNSVSQYENRDELFKGSLFDFRAYTTSLSEDLIAQSYDWGLEKLGLPSRQDLVPTVTATEVSKFKKQS